MTRKEFLNVTAGAAAFTVIPSTSIKAASIAQPASTGKPNEEYLYIVTLVC